MTAAFPTLLARYREIGGVLDFHVFKDVQAMDGDVALDVICAAVPGSDRESLRRIGYRAIDEQAFFGEWYDRDRRALIAKGTTRTADGRHLEDPLLVDLDGVQTIGGASPIPDAGSGGQFAYAFSHPPYPLRARPKEVQRIFDAIREHLLPPERAHIIFDWSDARLPEASAYFANGMEWWGVFLFTVHVPDFRRLVVVAGSATD